MKINVKTVKGETISFEVEPTTRIEELKAKVKERLNVDPINQKLIFKGKHLEDSKSLSELNVKDEDCFILMVLKVRSIETCYRAEKRWKTNGPR